MTGEVWEKKTADEEQGVGREKIEGARAMTGDRFNARAANSV
jgi:hypothetical protein